MIHDVIVADGHRLQESVWGFVLSNYTTKSNEVLISRKDYS
jgi:hypothetical protein